MTTLIVIISLVWATATNILAKTTRNKDLSFEESETIWNAQLIANIGSLGLFLGLYYYAAAMVLVSWYKLAKLERDTRFQNVQVSN